MEIINLILTLIVSFLGLPIGFLLAMIAKEELNKGESYFIWVQDIILIISVNSFFYSSSKNILTLAAIFFITSYLIVKFRPRAIIGYILLIIIFYLSLDNFNITLLISSFIFLYGLPTAALIKLEGLNTLKKPLRFLKYRSIIIGHRGAPHYKPENTLSSFMKAIELGVDMVEADARMTKDNEIVIIHDAAVDRTTDGKGRVNDMTLKDIKKLRISDTETIPTLQELIDSIKGRCRLNIHIKEDDKAVDRIIDIIKKNDFEKDVLLSSFFQTTLKRVKELDPKIKTAYLLRRPTLFYIEIGKRLDVYALHPMYSIITKRMVNKAHMNGFKVNVWTIKNKRSALKSRFYYKVDGIITDNPLLYKNNKKKS